VQDDYIEIEFEGLIFRFYFDPNAPGVLHIYSRHGQTVADALEVFFEGGRHWNAEHNRFESELGQRTVYWAWLHGRDEKAMLVISCFDKEQ
jgi:hypothetical protein